MISNPPIYYRQYANDVPRSTNNGNEDQAKRICAAVLPLLSFISALRTPLSLGMGICRNINHIQEIMAAIKTGKYIEVGIRSIQLALSLTALALVVTALATPYLNPSFSFVALGADDLISNLVEIVRAVHSDNVKSLVENSTQIITTILFVSFLYSGHIEILITLMSIQVIASSGKAIEEFSKGHVIEGICHVAFAILTVNQMIPQMKVLKWKWMKNPVVEGIICRDQRGFVYVKVKDEYIYDLNALFADSGSIPPYFGKGGHGAHITIIHAGGLPANIPMSEIGKSVKFTISYHDRLTTATGSTVSFLGVSCPELAGLRSKYGLTPKEGGNHDFHITFGMTNALP